MIRRFRHKGLERLFIRGDSSGINPWLASKPCRMLALLEEATGAEALNLPGYRLHQLKGDRAGQWAVMVCGNWRLVFEIGDGDADNVDLVDYH